jgi:hypothetical protein
MTLVLEFASVRTALTRVELKQCCLQRVDGELRSVEDTLAKRMALVEFHYRIELFRGRSVLLRIVFLELHSICICQQDMAVMTRGNQICEVNTNICVNLAEPC